MSLKLTHAHKSDFTVAIVYINEHTHSYTSKCDICLLLDFYLKKERRKEIHTHTQREREREREREMKFTESMT